MSNGTTPSPPEPESFPHAEEIKQRWEHARHSDRAAVDTGLTALNAAILVNAGSLVALLALSGQLWKDDRATATKILANSYSFVWGLALAVVASAVAYFYQSLVTRRELRTLGQMMGRNSTNLHRSARPHHGWPCRCVLRDVRDRCDQHRERPPVSEREVISDLDIWRAAQLLIKRYGADAPVQAAQRADELLNEGNLDGVAAWKRILHAVGELQRAAPKVGEKVN